MAADFIKNRITTGTTSSFVAKLLTPMIRIAAFEGASAASGADMFRLESIIWMARYSRG